MSSRHPSPMQPAHDLELQRGGWLGLPTGGWIIGLLAHTLVVWLRPLWAMAYEQVLQRERERLQQQQPRDTQP